MDHLDLGAFLCIKCVDAQRLHLNVCPLLTLIHGFPDGGYQCINDIAGCRSSLLATVTTKGGIIDIERATPITIKEGIDLQPGEVLKVTFSLSRGHTECIGAHTNVGRPTV